MATPLVFEDFNPGGNNDDLANYTTTGTGLTGNWANLSASLLTGNGTGPIIRTANNAGNGTALVYPTNSSLPAPAGGAAQKAAGGYPNDLYFVQMTNSIPLFGGTGNSTYYYSYLLDNGAGNVDYAAQLVLSGDLGPPGSNSGTQIYSGFGYGRKDAVSVVTTNSLPFGGGNSYNASGGSFSSGFSGGTIALVLGKLVVTPSGSDTISTKIFSYTAGQAAAAIPSDPSSIVWDATYTPPTAQTDTLTQVGIFEAGVTTPEIDAIRIGTAYSDAVGTILTTGPTGTFTVYTGATNGSFDTTTQNFKFNGSSVAFTNGSSVLFDDTATGTHNVVVATGGVSPSAVTFNNNASSYNLNGGPITSTGALVLFGPGTVTLSNSNTFGSVNLSNGSLVLGVGSLLSTANFTTGAGVLNLNGGTLQATNSSTSFLTGVAVTVSSGGAIIDTQSYNISIGSSIVGSAISPGGGLTKIGSGTLTLATTNNFTGGTTVNSGTLNMSAGGGSAALSGAVTVNAGAVVNATVPDAIGYSDGSSVTTLTVNKGGLFNITIAPTGINDVTSGNEGYITNVVLAGGTIAGINPAPDGTLGRFNFKLGYGITSLPSDTTATFSSNIQLRLANAIPINVSSGTTASGIDLLISGRIDEFEGSGLLNKFGTGTLSLTGVNTYTGGTNVSAGTLLIAGTNSLPSGTNLSVASGAKLMVANLNSTAFGLSVGTLAVTGVLDLNNNSLVVHSSTLAAVNGLAATGYNFGRWNGPAGLVSTAAAASSNHLTALAVIQNSGDGTPTGQSLFSTLNGQNTTDADVLVKYTYYGDANLDGKVDGSDYSLIDNGYANALTGWFNGDFNYDGVVDGSDYTLIDNAFNNQRTAFPSALAANSTAQIASAAVPEPTSLGLLGILTGVAFRRARRPFH